MALTPPTQHTPHTHTPTPNRRTLDLYTSAVLEAVLDAPSAPKPEWREMMAQLSKDSCQVYRSYVFKRPAFIEYFNLATPVGELGRLNIGEAGGRKWTGDSRWETNGGRRMEERDRRVGGKEEADRGVEVGASAGCS